MTVLLFIICVICHEVIVFIVSKLCVCVCGCVFVCLCYVWGKEEYTRVNENWNYKIKDRPLYLRVGLDFMTFILIWRSTNWASCMCCMCMYFAFEPMRCLGFLLHTSMIKHVSIQSIDIPEWEVWCILVPTCCRQRYIPWDPEEINRRRQALPVRLVGAVLNNFKVLTLPAGRQRGFSNADSSIVVVVDVNFSLKILISQKRTDNICSFFGLQLP